LAQRLNSAGDETESSTTSGGNRTGAFGEFHRLQDPAYWTYPEKTTTIAWSRTIRKQAEGLHGLNLGRVQAVGPRYVRTSRGFIRKQTFFIPRDLVQAFDGSTVWFGVEPGLERGFQRASHFTIAIPSGRVNTPSSTHLRVR
jgi:hypothetical protein